MRTPNPLLQVFNFCIVGGLAFAIDFGLLVLLTEAFGLYYLISSMIAFSVSVMFNYAASMRFVFIRKKDADRRKEFLVFVILSVMGLGLNQLGLWILVDYCSVFYTCSKMIMTAVVMIWNFVTRKIFLEDKNAGEQS